jgi:hypothetical protein
VTICVKDIVIAVIDGEVVMTDKDGVSDFFALHLALVRKSAPDATLMAFDVLQLDGEDLRSRPLEERRARLERLLRKPGPWLQFRAAAEGEGLEIWRRLRRGPRGHRLEAPRLALSIRQALQQEAADAVVEARRAHAVANPNSSA